MSQTFKKFKEGQSGAFTAEYHQLLGRAPWIVIRRLLRTAPQQDQLESGHSASGGQIGSSQVGEELSEGDVVTVFSQFGEVADVRFVRHRKTGRFLGTAFVRFKDYRSSIIAADEMNSNMEKGELVVLTQTADGDFAARGIMVERCEESEIPAMYNTTVESYEQWLERR